MDMIRKYAIFSFLAVLFFGSMVYAQYGSGGMGTSTISLSQSSITLSPGSSSSVTYTVKLSSGNIWGTTTNVADSGKLAADGISVSLSNTYGDPTYSGTMSINVSASTAPGTYTVFLNATGDDPSTSPASLTILVENTSSTTMPATSTIAIAQKPVFTQVAEKTIAVNASNGTSLTILDPFSKNLTVEINAGTYVKIGNSILPNYNFTIATYALHNVTSPPNESDYMPAFGFAYLVNGKLSPAIEFVNSTGSPMPLTTIAEYPSTWTSWAFLGGALNGTTYVGGKYALKNTWSYNATNSMLVNRQFVKPVMWVFVFSNVSTKPNVTVATTIPHAVSTTSVPAASPASGILPIAIIIVIVIIIVALLSLLKRSRK